MLSSKTVITSKLKLVQTKWLLLNKLIGEQEMFLIQLKIKEDVDHAGLSQLQAHFNLGLLLQKDL
jgi:hypothetical protein